MKVPPITGESWRTSTCPTHRPIQRKRANEGPRAVTAPASWSPRPRSQVGIEAYVLHTSSTDENGLTAHFSDTSDLSASSGPAKSFSSTNLPNARLCLLYAKHAAECSRQALDYTPLGCSRAQCWPTSVASAPAPVSSEASGSKLEISPSACCRTITQERGQTIAGVGKRIFRSRPL